jgi:uncharacterized OB-fold protein
MIALQKDREEKRDCFVLEGKMALPNQYFAGRLGSRFIIALRDRKKIMGLKCDTCGKTFVPPREYCVTCWKKIADNWVEVGPEGELVNFTVIRYGDRHLPKKPPYILGQIRLQGADTPLTHILLGIDPRDVQTGIRVKAVFADTPTNTILDIDHFEPV